MLQVIGFDTAKGGRVPNFCLANVCKGYSIPNRYADAWTAWLNTEQHTDAIPSGFDVPLYFSYWATIDGELKNWGHIGVQLKDGRFWSDGKIYANLGAYTNSPGRPKYVGWGESINEITILKEQNMSTIINNEQARILLFAIQGKNGLYDPKNALDGSMDADIKKYFAGRKLEDVLMELWEDKISKDYREKYQPMVHEAQNTEYVKLTDIYVRKAK